MGSGQKFPAIAIPTVRRCRNLPLRSSRFLHAPPTRAMVVTGCPELCPTCHALTFDGLAHFLQTHPGRDVPRSVVLAWIRKNPGRCARCYERVQDVELHRQGHHVSSVYLHLVGIGYRETVVRGDDGMFACPWCPEKRRFADLFKVRPGRHSVRNRTSDPHPVGAR
jgi:hypothetical protein